MKCSDCNIASLSYLDTFEITLRGKPKNMCIHCVSKYSDCRECLKEDLKANMSLINKGYYCLDCANIRND